MKHCAKATLKLEQAKFTKLTLGERMSLSFHLALCDACRKYKKDSEALDRILKTVLQSAQTQLSVTEKEEMIRALSVND